MIITNKKELEMAAEFLEKYANEKGNYIEFAAFGNVANVLKQAIEKGDFDDEHDAYTLQVVKQPNHLEYAAEKLCNTDCVLYRKGTCKYNHKDKIKCPTIYNYIYDEDED